MRSIESAKSLVDGSVRKFMTDDFLQEGRGSVEEKIGDSNLSIPREVEAQGDPHPRTRHESDS
jgi:hypothetical protein